MRLRLEAARSDLERSRVVDAETGEEVENLVAVEFSDPAESLPCLTLTVLMLDRRRPTDGASPPQAGPSGPEDPYVTSREIDPEAVRRAMR